MALPEEEEIKQVVWELYPDSAPGPDGLTGSFFQACWDCLGIKATRAEGATAESLFQ